MEENRDENRDLHKFLIVALSAMLDFLFPLFMKTKAHASWSHDFSCLYKVATSRERRRREDLKMEAASDAERCVWYILQLKPTLLGKHLGSHSFVDY